MAFIDNPAIGSMLSAVGLGHLLPGGDPAIAAGHSKPNVPTFKDRPYMPRNPQDARGAQAQVNPGPQPGQMDPATSANPTVSDLLNHFGVHPQQEVDPHLFIHNAAAWAAHPVMSGVLDGLLSGAANTRSGDTIGENISNVANSLRTTHDQQLEQVNNQMQIPYQQAMQVAALQQAKTQQDVEASTIKHNNSQSDYYDKLLDSRESIAQTQADAKVKAATVAGAARLALQKNKPVGMAQDLYDSHVAAAYKELNIDPNTDDPALIDQAKSLANKRILEAKETAKTTGAVNTAIGKLPSQIRLKAAPSGASGGSGNPRVDPQLRERVKQAGNEYNSYRNMTPSQIQEKTGQLVMDDKDKEAFLKPYKDKYESYVDQLGGGTKPAATPAPQTATHRYNPATGTIEAIK